MALHAHAGSPTRVIGMWDNDHDGTLDLNEINKPAESEFDKLDIDRDSTLDVKELVVQIIRLVPGSEGGPRPKAVVEPCRQAGPAGRHPKFPVVG